MDFDDRITITPEVRSGKPCIKGTRITVYDVLEYLAGGMSEAELLADFPELRPQDIRAVLASAASSPSIELGRPLNLPYSGNAALFELLDDRG